MSERIHRTEYTERVGELAKAFRRCSVETRVPKRWSSITKRCIPTPKEACAFETIGPEEVNREQDELSRKELDLQYIGCGLGRCTYEFKSGCVVKFARSGRRGQFQEIVGHTPWWAKPNLTGEDQNTYEVASYSVTEDKIKDLLVPIVAHSPVKQYKWIVLPKVETHNQEDFDECEGTRIADRLENELEERGAKCEDVHYNNVGRLIGRDVLLDYGFGLTCRRKSTVKTKKKRKVPPRRLGEFMATHPRTRESRRFKPCLENGDCNLLDEACVDGVCKKPTDTDIQREVSKLADARDGALLNDSEYNEVTEYLDNAWNLKGRANLQAMANIQVARHRLQEHERSFGGALLRLQGLG